MSERKRRIPRFVMPAALLLAATAAVLLLAAHVPSLGKIDLLQALGIVRTAESRSAAVLLAEVRNLCKLDTVEMVYKTVFPYDYMDPALDLHTIIAATRSTDGSVASLLTPDQELYLRAYNLSHDLGLQTGPDHYDFVVVTTVVLAGVDLEAPEIAHPEAASKQDISRWLRVETSSDSHRRVTVTLPDAVITELQTEDPNNARYLYPDVRIPPAGWKRISAFVADHVRQEVEAGDLLARARSRAGDLVESFLKSAGFDSVTIVE